MEVQFGLPWNGWSEKNLQFDALKRSNLSLSNLWEKAKGDVGLLFCYKAGESINKKDFHAATYSLLWDFDSLMDNPQFTQLSTIHGYESK